MSFLPIAINVENKKILIIGGGNVALQKVKKLLPFCKNITIVAPKIKEDLKKIHEVNIIVDIYRGKYLKDMFMVYACTNNSSVNEQVLKDSGKKGILCNRTDKSKESHFHSSAILETENLVVGINTKGKSPKRLIQIRNDLRNFILERKALYELKPEYKGCVFLVGFGPGNPNLITKRGDQLLSVADVIFYDDLLDAGSLEIYPGKKVYVGKRRNNHSKEQDEINDILYRSAKKGNMVVRLKGGDPLIFGRGSEERFYLEERGIHVEIVPGISSAIAAAAYGNIPLTHRGISSSVAFGTAHAKNSYKVLESGTSVYYMGAKNIRQIAQKYLKKGYPEDYPVGIIHQVSMPGQKILITNIKEIADGIHEIESPAISIFGNTVNYRSIMKQQKINNADSDNSE